MLCAEFLILGSTTPASGGNIIVEYFVRGGPIMWPILVVSIIALAVVLERLIWWMGASARSDNQRLEKVYDAVRKQDLRAASAIARGSKDPRLIVLWNGLNYTHDTMEGALQVAARIEIQKASRFLNVMDTIITLAPLLGLLGTVTGIMGAFSAVSGEGGGLNVDAVSGGIGEALIATACGLTVAMFCLIPFNYFSSRVQGLGFELENAATNLDVIMKGKPIDLVKDEADFAVAS